MLSQKKSGEHNRRRNAWGFPRGEGFRQEKLTNLAMAQQLYDLASSNVSEHLAYLEKDPRKKTHDKTMIGVSYMIGLLELDASKFHECLAWCTFYARYCCVADFLYVCV